MTVFSPPTSSAPVPPAPPAAREPPQPPSPPRLFHASGQMPHLPHLPHSPRMPRLPSQMPAHWQRPGGPWWIKASWQRYLHDLLLFRSRRRYSLSLSEHHPLGATDPHTRQVLVNPVQIAYPAHRADRQLIRHCPVGRDAFEQAITVALVEHEAGHIRWSGPIPHEETLRWVWNSLEDERMERRLARQYPELSVLFTFLGDAVWREQPATNDLLSACLLWRWEHDRPAHERKFVPASPTEATVWEQAIRPLVEDAWAATDSEAVVALAREILRRLHLPEDQPLPDTAPTPICGCGGGEAGEAGAADASSAGTANSRGGRDDPSIPQTAPLVPSGARIPGRPATPVGGPGVGSGLGHDPDDPAQADPTVLLTTVEGPARDLARWLRPPVTVVRQRPHPCRGELDLERALAHNERPYDLPSAPAPQPARAWMLLIDESGSMGAADTAGSPMAGAVRTAMWLDRAAELAQVALGILGFDAGSRPIVIRPLSVGSSLLERRRIAGMNGNGGTALLPSLRAAIDALHASHARRKVLIVLHDGQLSAQEARDVQQVCGHLPKQGIQLLPLYLGADGGIIQANTQVFGKVLACPDLSQLSAKLCSWLRASGV